MATTKIIDESFVEKILKAHDSSTQASSELMVKTQSNSVQSKAKTSRSSGSQSKPVQHTDTEAPKNCSRNIAQSSDRSDKHENNSQKDKVLCGSGGANPVTVNSQSLTGTESNSMSLIENENPPVKKRNSVKTIQAGKENPNCSKDCRVSGIALFVCKNLVTVYLVEVWFVLIWDLCIEIL